MYYFTIIGRENQNTAVRISEVLIRFHLAYHLHAVLTMKFKLVNYVYNHSLNWYSLFKII